MRKSSSPSISEGSKPTEPAEVLGRLKAVLLYVRHSSSKSIENVAASIARPVLVKLTGTNTVLPRQAGMLEGMPSKVGVAPCPSKTNTSHLLLVSSATRLVARDGNATKRPRSDTAGANE